MTKIAIINGPNLNRLGKRNPEIYGAETFEETFKKMQTNFTDIELVYFQSNSEGAIIDAIQQFSDSPDIKGIVINPGAYAHYSYAIADAVEDTPLPVVEVHISDIHAREDFRRHSVTSRGAIAMISGKGREGYSLAVLAVLDFLKKL